MERSGPKAKNEKNPLVSIIIPIYNGESTLRPCIDSIISQDFKDYELILVDNNSKDRTKEIILSYKKDNPKIRYIFESIKKRGAARNTGEKASKGKIVLMTDSDCIVPKDWIKDMIGPILKQDFDAVQGFQINISSDYWSERIQKKSDEKYHNVTILDKGKILGMIDTKNFAIKREVLKRIGFSSQYFFSGNDTELSIRLSKENIKIRFLKYAKVEHNHPDSLKKMIKKQFTRARWTRIITRKNNGYLKGTDFPKNTFQRPYSFLSFFPGLIHLVLRGKFQESFFEAAEAIPWRVGLIVGSF